MKYANEYYNGRYDAAHAYVLQLLAAGLTIEDKDHEVQTQGRETHPGTSLAERDAYISHWWIHRQDGTNIGVLCIIQ